MSGKLFFPTLTNIIVSVIKAKKEHSNSGDMVMQSLQRCLVTVLKVQKFMPSYGDIGLI